MELIEYLWHVIGELTPTDIGNGYIVIRFTNRIDYETALIRGPWLILSLLVCPEIYSFL